MAVVGSDILIKRGALEEELLPAREGRSRVAVLSQAGAIGVARTVHDRLAASGLTVELVTVPDGEDAKSLDVARDTYLALNQMGMTRHDSIVAVGGGSVTDLGGFVAATYLRGIEAIYVPTTLLGAVDASIGGKTGVNVGGKNLVGVFAHPARIVIDLDVLDALPDHLRRQGMSEALKAGLIGDPDLVVLLEQRGLGADLKEVVSRAVAVKTGIVEADFREAGQRAMLNYGHTVGHAVEMSAGVSHGEAVAIGMVAAGAVSAALAGFTGAERQRTIIESLGLPVVVPGEPDRGDLLELIGLDKKRDASGIRMVLLEAIGSPVLKTVDDDLIETALNAIGVTGNG